MEKKYPSWEVFKAKYPSEQLQRDRFEDLVRSLFCDRFGLKYGVFSTGIMQVMKHKRFPKA